MLTAFGRDQETINRSVRRLQIVLCVSTGLMVALSWPLWVDRSDWPRIPFLAIDLLIPVWISWVHAVGIMATLGLATLGIGGRRILGLAVALLAAAMIRDQNRAQPWAGQFAVIGLAMATWPGTGGLRVARWSVVILYLDSGLSKLDASFCRELGPTMLAVGLEPFGFNPNAWTSVVQSSASLVLPGFEVLVAILLAVSKTRPIGLIAAILQHLGLLLILGPWGLDHSGIVLIWNIDLIAEDLILFGSNRRQETKPDEPIWESRVAIAIALGLATAERWGYCDAWPAHALYASHCERSAISVQDQDRDEFPDAIRRRIAIEGVGPWRRFDVTGWSRDVRGTPPYPSGRVGNAVAEYLERLSKGSAPLLLEQWGRASLWTDRRVHDQSLGHSAIRVRGDQFFWNAHPRLPPPTPPG